MSWLKKSFSSQSSQSFSQQKLVEDDDSNEPKVCYSTHISTKTDVPNSHNQVAHKKMEDNHSEQENEDNSQQEKESEKISFYLKLGKYKKFKYM